MGDHVQETEPGRHSDDGEDDYDEDDDNASGGGGSNDRRQHGDHGDDSQADDDNDDDGDDDDGDEDGNHDGDTAQRSARPRRNKKRLPGHPNVVQIVQRPRTHVNHTYRDFSSIPNGGSYSIPGDIDRMTFTEKLYHLLSSTSSYAQESIAWRPHGRAFRIKSEDFFQKYGLLKLYFGYARVQRFFKQLLNHDFKQITQGPDKGCFYNEYFLRGMPHLLPYFPEPMERRRLLADPENEPNFSEIACLFYLPGDRRFLVQEARNRLQRQGILIWDAVFESVASTTSSAAFATATASAAPTAALSVARPPPAAHTLAWTDNANTYPGVPAQTSMLSSQSFPSTAHFSYSDARQQQRASGTSGPGLAPASDVAATGEEIERKPAAKKQAKRRTER